MASISIKLGRAVVVAMTTIGAGSTRAEEPTPDTKPFQRPAEIGAGVGKAATDQVWSLGRKIFFDPRVSSSGTISCASCHQPSVSWTDRLPKAVGEAHKPLAFRAPTLLNAGHIERYGWTGRFPSVEATAFFAMGSAANMNVSFPRLIADLERDPDYVARFRTAFSDGRITKENVGIALERFVTSIVSDVAPFDRWVAGDKTAMSASATRGFALFAGKGKCAECHSGWSFTDGSFHDVGTATGSNIGRGALFKTSIKLQYAYKTPTLRDVAIRAPYMHDGGVATLAAVVEHYDKGGIDRPSRATAIKPLNLTPDEKRDLVAFLETLSGGSTFVIKAAR